MRTQNADKTINRTHDSPGAQSDEWDSVGSRQHVGTSASSARSVLQRSAGVARSRNPLQPAQALPFWGGGCHVNDMHHAMLASRLTAHASLPPVQSLIDAETQTSPKKRNHQQMSYKAINVPAAFLT